MNNVLINNNCGDRRRCGRSQQADTVSNDSICNGGSADCDRSVHSRAMPSLRGVGVVARSSAKHGRRVETGVRCERAAISHAFPRDRNDVRKDAWPVVRVSWVATARIRVLQRHTGQCAPRVQSGRRIRRARSTFYGLPTSRAEYSYQLNGINRCVSSDRASRSRSLAQRRLSELRAHERQGLRCTDPTTKAHVACDLVLSFAVFDGSLADFAVASRVADAHSLVLVLCNTR